MEHLKEGCIYALREYVLYCAKQKYGLETKVPGNGANVKFFATDVLDIISDFPFEVTQ